MIGSLWYAIFSLSLSLSLYFFYYYYLFLKLLPLMLLAACDCLCLLKFLMIVVCCCGEWLLLSLLVLLSLLIVLGIWKMLDFSIAFSLSKKGEWRVLSQVFGFIFGDFGRGSWLFVGVKKELNSFGVLSVFGKWKEVGFVFW